MRLTPMYAYAEELWQTLFDYLCMRGKPVRFSWVDGNDRKVTDERKLYKNSEEFYLHTDVYLYHDIGFFIEGWKTPYYDILGQVGGEESLSLLDFGCGSGYDGLLLRHSNFSVSFADVQSSAMAYLIYRLARSDIPSPTVYILPNAQSIIPRHDVVWCIDVLEHLAPVNHEEFFLQLQTYGATVMCTLVKDISADSLVHYPVDVEGLTALAKSQGPIWWKDFYLKSDGSYARLLVSGERVARIQEPSGLDIETSSLDGLSLYS